MMGLTKAGVDPSRIDRTWEHLGLVYINYYFVIPCDDLRYTQDGDIVKDSNDRRNYCLHIYKGSYKDGEHTQQQEKQNVIDAWEEFKRLFPVSYERMEQGELMVVLQDEFHPTDTWFPNDPVINGSYEKYLKKK
jgi:hypothetical protein